MTPLEIAGAVWAGVATVAWLRRYREARELRASCKGWRQQVVGMEKSNAALGAQLTSVEVKLARIRGVLDDRLTGKTGTTWKQNVPEIREAAAAAEATS